MRFSRINILFIFFIFSFSAYAENWVGTAATLQLIEGTALADGSKFIRDDIAAACNGFKLGSEITIINPKNGKSVVAVVKDRVPEDTDYFILLTQKAARDIELEWDTALVVVEGKFSDINSTERLDVNGLIKEGELDPESLKLFPDIKWPKDEKITTEKAEVKIEDSNQPPVDKEAIPAKKEEKGKIGLDDKNDYKITEESQYKETPPEEKTSIPTEKMKKHMISSDTDNGESKEQKIEIIEEKEKIIVAMNDNQKIETEKKETKKEIKWEKELLKNNVYIRISTAFDKTEGERRYALFSMIFPNIVGIEEPNKYILFVGPVDKEKVNLFLTKIKSYGFKDAYIVKK